MKKLLLLLVTLMMLLSMAACKKKDEVIDDNQDEVVDTVDDTKNDENNQDIEVDGDPLEYTREYWEEKFPGRMICPFYIEENGVEYNYYYVTGEDSDGTMNYWITTIFNWNGWHKVGNDIVNKDETLKMTDEWVNEDAATFSSFCTINTVPFDKNAVNTEVDDHDVYEFDGYTTEGTWPTEGAWASFGLPNLVCEDAGRVEISTADWIYPLDAEDGVLLECTPETRHFEDLVNILNDAGIEGEYYEVLDEKWYYADYTFNGDPMRLTLTEYGDGDLVVFVQYKPYLEN